MVRLFPPSIASLAGIHSAVTLWMRASKTGARGVEVVMALLRPIRTDVSRPAVTAAEGPSDAALLRHVALGSESAFASLWARTGPAVYAVCRRVLPDAGAAEDAAQDAFVRIWRGADRFDPRRGNAAAWMYTIARNSALNIARIQHPSPTAEIDARAHDDGDLIDTSRLTATLIGGPARPGERARRTRSSRQVVGGALPGEDSAGLCMPGRGAASTCAPWPSTCSVARSAS